MVDFGLIDFHAHVVVDLPNFAERFGDPRWPSFLTQGDEGRLTRNGQVVRSLPPSAWLPRRRIEELDESGVDRQVLSPVPPLICDFGDASLSSQWAAHVNDAIATLVADNPSRFSGLGTVPLRYPEAAIRTLQRAHDSGLSGVEIGTSAGQRELDDPALREFFSAAAELDMIIFVHPLALDLSAYKALRIDGPAVTFGLGMGTDTAVAAAHLVFGGVTADNPELKICLAHGGGTFFWALTRIAHMWQQQGGQAIGEITRNVFVDSVVYDPGNLRYLCGKIGPEKVLFGTDYPLPAQADLHGTVLAELPEVDAVRIGRQNASELLGLCPTCH